MSNPIQLKRSATPAKVPTTSDLALGEIGINTYDGKMYIKKDNGTPSIVEIGAGGGGSSPYVVGQVVQAPSAPSDGGTWLDCDGSSVLQSSYSALYTAIGQQFLRYTASSFQASSISNQITSIEYAFSKYWVSCTTTSGSSVRSSTNGTTWINASIGSATACTTIKLLGTRLFAFGNSTTTSYYTDDGTTWTACGNTQFAGFTGAALSPTLGSGSGRILAIQPGGPTAYSDNNGVSWTSGTNVGSGNNVLWNGTAFVIWGSKTAQSFTLTSTTGIGASWVTNNPETTGFINRAAGTGMTFDPSNGDLYASGFGTLYTPTFYKSTDTGATFSKINELNYVAVATGSFILSKKMTTGTYFFRYATAAANALSNMYYTNDNFKTINMVPNNWPGLINDCNNLWIEGTNEIWCINDVIANNYWLKLSYNSTSTNFNVPLTPIKSWIKAS